MKKYISLICITAVFGLQSCERNESVSNVSEQIQERNEVQSIKESARVQNALTEKESYENKETGDDDEPKRDKQHWRIVRDTV
ncbi:hypothetical protein PQ459_10815 [Chryseobacterium sp. KACC 21268]|nr:hypothetical protein PQ459_10815 [Chryseobacterium sp. KACC 21268]